MSTNYRSQPQKEETEPKEADLKLLSAIYQFAIKTNINKNTTTQTAQQHKLEKNKKTDTKQTQ